MAARGVARWDGDVGSSRAYEDVVKLGRGRQHLGLGLLPDVERHRDELPLRQLRCFERHAAFLEGDRRHRAEDLDDGRRGGQGDVHHVEVALGAVGDVVFASARRQHTADKVEVNNGLPLARLGKVVHARELDELPHGKGRQRHARYSCYRQLDELRSHP